MSGDFVTRTVTPPDVRGILQPVRERLLYDCRGRKPDRGRGTRQYAFRFDGRAGHRRVNWPVTQASPLRPQAAISVNWRLLDDRGREAGAASPLIEIRLICREQFLHSPSVVQNHDFCTTSLSSNRNSLNGEQLRCKSNSRRIESGAMSGLLRRILEENTPHSTP